MRAWITKYLFTAGIQEKEVRFCDDGKTTVCDSGAWAQYFHKGDWHRTEIDAKARAIAMIAKKRASIKKQLAAINNLEAEIMGTEAKQ